MTDLKLAESAFVKAVVKALKLQDEMLELRMKLQQVDAEAQRANDAALKEAGLSDESEFDDIMEVQERWLKAALDASELPDDSPVRQATLHQIEQARAQVAAAVVEENAMLGKIRGPEF